MSGNPPSHRFTGIVYRAHNPRWAYAPTSGEGAARHGGRFNRPGISALYTALDVKIAWLEAQQGFPFKAQPMTLVAYQVDCDKVVNLQDHRVLAKFVISPETLASPWEHLASQGLVPPTWELADRLTKKGFAGILVRSYAPGCGPENVNLVLWNWLDRLPCLIRVIDDYGRLPQNDASWQ